MTTRQPSPPALVDGGRFNFGMFDAAIPTVNLLDADVFPGLPVPRKMKNLRLKEWQAFQMGNGRYFLNVALFNGKTLAVAQIKLYDRQLGKKFLFERKMAPWRFEVACGLLDSETSYHRDDCSISFRNQLTQDRIHIEMDVAATPAMPRIKGSVTALAAGCDPLVVCIPFADNRGMYSHKGLMRAQGQLAFGDSEIVFGDDDGYVLMDDHKGYYPYRMKWDWVTAGGYLEDRRFVGFNLTKNQSIDPDRFHENCLWVDGVAHVLGPVTFARHSGQTPEVWTVRDKNGRVNVTFTVEVDGRVDINALILRSRYRGPFGTFSGTIVDDAGEPVVLDGMFGMGEDFYVRG
jgi:hypothetical protein